MTKASAEHSIIVNAASDLFIQKGYTATGIDEVITKAKVTRGTLYAHFPTKEELCLAYLKVRNKEVLDILAIKCASAPNGPGQILALFDFLAHFYENQDFCGCWARQTAAEQAPGDTKIRSEVLKGKAELVQFITTLLAENMTSLGSEERAALARKIYLLYEGAVSESHLQLNIWPVTEAREMCEILLRQAKRQS